MLQSASTFIGIPIIDLVSTKIIGKVLEFIADPDSGKLIGIVVEKKGFFKNRHRVLSLTDIREVSARAIIVDSNKSLVWQQDIVKIDEILKSKKIIIGSKVSTISGRYIGRVYDYLIDRFFNIAKLFVYPPLLNIFDNQLIIPSNYILEVKRGIIIIKDIASPEKVVSNNSKAKNVKNT